MPSTICLVTGVDQKMFPQLLLLAGSLRRHSPTLTLHVCDFGLTEAQRSYVRRRHVLLDKPADIRPRHPWDCKANLSRYVAAVAADVIVWIDVDTILLADVAEPLQQLLAEMSRNGHVLAVADSGVNIGDQLAAEPAPSYAGLVQRFDQAAPYLNSGFFLCRARGFLDVWAAQTAIMSFEKLYEQNAFNLVVLGSPQQVRILDRFRWNLVANDLDSTRIEVSGTAPRITGPTAQALILHATSTERARDLVELGIPLSYNGCEFSISLRMIKRPAELLPFQQQLAVEAIQAESTLLIDCGVWPYPESWRRTPGSSAARRS
jgi:hypothetical protein